MSSSGAIGPRHRPRRQRRSEAIRGLVRESQSRVSVLDLVWPVFVQEGVGKQDPIPALAGQFKYSPDMLLPAIEGAISLGIRAIALFPAVPEEKKSELAEEACNPEGLIPTVVRSLKELCPDLVVITDVALDPYNSDGHDGIVEDGVIVNDKTLEQLCKMAVVQADAGADVVAPSDMMDGRVSALRDALDQAGHQDVLICSYTAKYCSAFYGPFRLALDSAPRGGSQKKIPSDKKTYQMDPSNRREALRELRLDEEECADWVMVKPAVHYLDIIRDFREHSTLPVAAYHVSGEYAMLMAAVEKGLVEHQRGVMEVLTSIKRAGADIIFTYAAVQVAAWLAEGGGH